MPNWDAVAASVKRQVDKNGRALTLRQQGNNSQDSDKPWRGQDDYHDGSVSGLGVFVSPGASLGLVATVEDGLKRAEQVVYFAAANDTGQELEYYDQIVDGTTTWQIVSAQVLNPAGTRLLYLFGVAR